MVKTMFDGIFLALATSAALLSLGLHPAHAAGPKRSLEEILANGQAALAASHFQEAADLMDEAFRLDNYPVWLANAGYARMMAGQLDRAIENLSGALQDRRLKGEGRDRAIERLGLASAARAHLARSEEAKAKGDFASAARGYDSDPAPTMRWGA